jgi:ABC-2 type transport system permease protein
MRDALVLYRRLVGARVRSLMQYRFSFIVSFFMQALMTVNDFLVVLTLLYHFRAMGGWSLYEVGVLYGITSSASALNRTFFNEVHHFPDYVMAGDFDSLLLRPWPTLLVLVTRGVEFFRLGGAAQGLIPLYICVHLLGGFARFGGLGVLYISLLPILGAVIYFAVEVAVASLAFWFGRIQGFQTTTSYIVTYAGSYPLGIYPDWLQKLRVWSPAQRTLCAGARHQS